MNRPFAGLTNTGGAQTQAMTTALGQLVAFSAAGGSNGLDSYTRYGDPACRADNTNNRVLVNAPGIYRARLVLSGTMTTGADLIGVFQKNAVTIAGIKGKARVTTAKGQLIVEGTFEVTTDDLKNAAAANVNGVATFADPASTEFIGAGAAPKTEVPITAALSIVTSTDTLAIEEATLTVERLDG